MNKILRPKSQRVMWLPPRLKTSRNGVIVFAVLACLAIAMIIVLAAVQSSLKQRRQLRPVTQMEQVRWLLDGGISKAVELVQTGGDIPTEPLDVELGLEKYSSAQIEFQKINSSPADTVRLLVTARIGKKSQPETVQRSLEVWIPRKPD
jgi:hypothetical protein